MCKVVLVHKSVVPRVVRWINVNAFHALAIRWLQCAQGGVVVGVQQFAAKRRFDVVKTGQHAGLEVGIEMPGVQRQVRVGGQQFLSVRFLGLVAHPQRPFPGLCCAGTGLRHQRLPGLAGLAQQPTALHQVVGLQHKFTLLEQRGLKALDLRQKGDQVQRDVTHQLVLGADARQLGIRRVPNLYEFLLEVNVKLAA